MNYYQLQNPSNTIPKSFNCDTLEGNWYEDRCIPDYDKRKKRDYLLPNPFSWQYEKTYNEIDKAWKDYPKVKERFSEASDNCINFQEKDNNMFITTYKHTLDAKYKETFRQPIKVRDFYKNKQDDLKEYRDTWTKRQQNFDTTYNADILTKTGSSLISNNIVNRSSIKKKELLNAYK
jgi:hypothetical protein